MIIENTCYVFSCIEILCDSGYCNFQTSKYISAKILDTQHSEFHLPHILQNFAVKHCTANPSLRNPIRHNAALDTLYSPSVSNTELHNRALHNIAIYYVHYSTVSSYLHNTALDNTALHNISLYNLKSTKHVERESVPVFCASRIHQVVFAWH